MNIFYYDSDKFDTKEISDMFHSLPKELRENTICLPKDCNLLIDCSTYELYQAKKKIEDALRAKEILNEM
jgi:hypothetical protein